MPDTIPTADALPDGLTTRTQWVCWRTQTRNDKQTKVPINPETVAFASTTKPETWTSFTQARERAAGDDSLGLGFVFTDDDPIVGVDLDDCRDPNTGAPDTMAETVIEQLDSYTEVSPSGTGYHVLTLGTLPEGRNRRGNLELYDTARFFTVTGDHVTGTPTSLSPASDALTSVSEEYLMPNSVDSGHAHDSDSLDDIHDGDETATGTSAGSSAEAPSSSIGPDADTSLSDEALLEKAQAAANGDKFSRLWAGTTTGYDSHSEADMALCALLAFWTGGDETQMDRLFRQSGLMREKWDDIHYADGSTYGERTIDRAIEGCSSFYDPGATKSNSTSATGDTAAVEDATAATTKTENTATTADVDSDPPATTTAELSRDHAESDTVADVVSDLASERVDPGIDRTVPDASDVTLSQIEQLVAELETAREHIEHLETALDAERNCRRELAAELSAQNSRSRWWWPF